MRSVFLPVVILLLYVIGINCELLGQGQTGFTTSGHRAISNYDNEYLIFHAFNNNYPEDFFGHQRFSTKLPANRKAGADSVLLTSKDPDFSGTAHKLTLKLKLCDTANLDLYNDIKAGKTITGCYITALDFNKLDPVVKGNTVTIQYPLKFLNCFIGKLILPKGYEPLHELSGRTRGSIDSIIFNKEVVFKFCNFSESLRFTNAAFKSDVSYVQNIAQRTVRITNSVFFKDFHIYSDAGYVSGYSSNTLSAQDYPRGGYVLAGSNFLGRTFIYNSLSQYVIRLQGNSFAGRTTFANYVYGPNKFSDTRHQSPLTLFESDFYFLRDTLYGLKLFDCTFHKTVNFENIVLRESNFNDCSFADSLILYQTQLDSIASFGSSYFQHEKENVIIVSPEEFDIKNIKINTASFSKVNFPYTSPDSAIVWDEKHRQDYNNYYDRLETDINNIFVNKKELAEELTNKVRHQKKLNDIEYYRNNLASNFFAYICNSFTELIVRHGYHGERNFFTAALVVIFLFSLLYFFGYKSEVIAYLNRISEKTEAQKHPARWDLITYARSFWVSFYIFINPRLKPLFFNLPKSLFLFFLLEWVIGLVMIIFFLIYIASKYAFIKSLIGL